MQQYNNKKQKYFRTDDLINKACNFNNVPIDQNYLQNKQNMINEIKMQ